MTVLAIDTAARRRVVGVVTTAAGGLLHGRAVEGSEVGRALPPLLAELIDASLSAVVVVIGPGSYTGVRAGMAAAAGLAHTRGVPLHGAGTLAVVAGGMPVAGECLAVVLAGRGGAYAARCRVDASGCVCAEPVRAQLADLERVAAGTPIACCDPLDAQPAVRVDPVQALARAVPAALAAAPLPLDGLRATHVA